MKIHCAAADSTALSRSGQLAISAICALLVLASTAAGQRSAQATDSDRSHSRWPAWTKLFRGLGELNENLGWQETRTAKRTPRPAHAVTPAQVRQPSPTSAPGPQAVIRAEPDDSPESSGSLLRAPGWQRLSLRSLFKGLLGPEPPERTGMPTGRSAEDAAQEAPSRVEATHIATAIGSLSESNVMYPRARQAEHLEERPAPLPGEADWAGSATEAIAPPPVMQSPAPGDAAKSPVDESDETSSEPTPPGQASPAEQPEVTPPAEATAEPSAPAPTPPAPQEDAGQEQADRPSNPLARRSPSPEETLPVDSARPKSGASPTTVDADQRRRAETVRYWMDRLGVPETIR